MIRGHLIPENGTMTAENGTEALKAERMKEEMMTEKNLRVLRGWLQREISRW